MLLVHIDIAYAVIVKYVFSIAAQRHMLCCEFRSDRLGVQWISTACLFVGRLSSAQGNLGGSKDVV